MAPIPKTRALHLLREIARNYHLTNAELAKMLGVSPRTVSRYRRVLREFFGKQP
jgi:DNA-binding CsgD family transcriptional regulator